MPDLTTPALPALPHARSTFYLPLPHLVALLVLCTVGPTDEFWKVITDIHTALHLVITLPFLLLLQRLPAVPPSRPSTVTDVPPTYMVLPAETLPTYRPLPYAFTTVIPRTLVLLWTPTFGFN